MTKKYTVVEIANSLEISIKTVHSHIKKKNLKGEKVKGKWYFSQNQFDEFVANRRPSNWPTTRPVEGCYTNNEAVSVLSVSRQTVAIWAKRYGWRVSRGLFDKNKIDLFNADRN